MLRKLLSARVSPWFAALLAVLVFVIVPLRAQQTLGSIDGTVTDSSGAVVQGAAISIRNTATNLVVTAQTKDDGSFSVIDLPIGTYEVTFSKDGFQKQVYSQIVLRGGLTTTVRASLSPGQISTSVTVEASPSLNETDTSNGYTLGTDVIESTPLGTGSFTQLAILAPGTSADFLSGSGSNEGLGNQGIVANGQTTTSNSFSFNSVNANNLFNGNSTSNVSDSRFTLNTGEVFGAGGQVQTNTSVFDSIGEGLPTPPVETIAELHVTTSMYDASMGQNSGAQIELTTRSGTNNYHGQVYGYLQNNMFDAAPTFLTKNAFFSGAPPLHRDSFGGTLGGPIKKDKLFFFGSYQRQRVTDALNGAFSGVPTIQGLTANNRDAADLVALVNTDNACGVGSNPVCVTVGQVDPVALKLLQAKVGNQFLIPNSGVGITSGESSSQKFNSAILGPPSTFKANQANGNVDYVVNSSDRVAAKYYFQRNPTGSPFAVSGVAGFPQSLAAGSQVLSLDNTKVLTPSTTWEQRFGFIRQYANATTSQALTPSDIGITLPNGNFFPGFGISNADVFAPVAAGGTVAPAKGNKLTIGPSTNFANAGVFQNQFEGSTKYNWVVGAHTLAFGATYDYSQLNVENRENNVATFTFNNTADFLTGNLNADKSSGTLLDGETNRHFRARQAGLYAQDSYKIKPNLTVNYGLRWDWDGPLYESNGLLTSFSPADYNYSLANDAFSAVNGTPGVGIVVAGNNSTLGTKGISNSTLTGRQWGFAPRFGLVWSPKSNLVVRTAFGMFYNRGEYFTELSPTAGSGISGPFGVTTEQPFTIKCSADSPSAVCSTGCATTIQCLSSAPFGTSLTPPPNSLAGIAALVPNMRQMADCSAGPVPGMEQANLPWCTPATTGTTVEPFLFGGYNPTNKLPYATDWSLDLQWQPANTLVVTLGYTGNHGFHEVLPIPFNQPGIATPTNPINNQIYTFGYLGTNSTTNAAECKPSATCFALPSEAVQTNLNGFSFSDGNTALRAKYLGINPNSALWTAEGQSNYDALELGVNKKLSHNLQVTASYTYSHSLDEGSGIGSGFFFNGNNPAVPSSSYASSDFDRTHVFIVSYLYNLPTIKNASRWVGAVANGWGVTGVTTVQSGEPFSVIDFSGVAGSIFFSADDEVTNPILPLQAGVSPKQATIGGTDGVFGPSSATPGLAVPYVNPNAFAQPLIAQGQDGLPPCQTVSGVNVCDNVETGFGATGRNAFRAPFETLFNFSMFKNFSITETVKLKFEADAFNLFNHPDFDTPDTDFELNSSCFNPRPCPNFTPFPPNTKGYGVIDGTVGSNRFMQFSLHLTF
jgi:hypothetical protein